MATQNIWMVKAEPRADGPSENVITHGGVVSGGNEEKKADAESLMRKESDKK